MLYNFKRHIQSRKFLNYGVKIAKIDILETVPLNDLKKHKPYILGKTHDICVITPKEDLIFCEGGKKFMLTKEHHYILGRETIDFIKILSVDEIRDKENDTKILFVSQGT